MALFRRHRKPIDLVVSGSRAVGTVVGVEDAGLAGQGEPQVRVSFRIEPRDGSPPFDADRVIPSDPEMPRPGERYPIWFDPKDPIADWAFGTIADDRGREEVRDQFGEVAESFAGFGPRAEAPRERGVVAGQLAKLRELRAHGVLTDAEYVAARDRLLD